MYGYIYKTTNLCNGKIYIGQKKSTKFLGESYLGSGVAFLQAVKKYGKDSFSVELIEECESAVKLNEREIHWIAEYNATDPAIGYNISTGGGITCLPGEKNPFYHKHHTEETRQKMRDAHKHRIYRPHTDEEKLHISQALKGRECTWKDKLSKNAQQNPNYGMKGKKLSEATKQKLAEKAKERCSSAEFRNKLSSSTKSAWQDPEYRRIHAEGVRRAMTGNVYKRETCPVCGKSIGLNNFKRHVATHNK